MSRANEHSLMLGVAYTDGRCVIELDVIPLGLSTMNGWTNAVGIIFALLRLRQISYFKAFHI